MAVLSTAIHSACCRCHVAPGRSRLLAACGRFWAPAVSPGSSSHSPIPCHCILLHCFHHGHGLAGHSGREWLNEVMLASCRSREMLQSHVVVAVALCVCESSSLKWHPKRAHRRNCDAATLEPKWTSAASAAPGSAAAEAQQQHPHTNPQTVESIHHHHHSPSSPSPSHPAQRRISFHLTGIISIDRMAAAGMRSRTADLCDAG